jgi:Cu/Ag efflux pump CusA
VLIVPMCQLASVTGLLFRGMPIDILAQIGFVVLVGLAAKNAILIVEFARQAQDAGSTPAEAAVGAARRRLRPILITSLAFILGVAPLVVATGAGAEMRQSLGTAVFAGMLGVTGFGLVFRPSTLSCSGSASPAAERHPICASRESRATKVKALQLERHGRQPALRVRGATRSNGVRRARNPR